MPKYSGYVGFGIAKENPEGSGIWVDGIVRRRYYGETIRNYSRNSNGDGLNDNLVLSNQISIVADPFANSHCHSIKYVEFTGSLWKVTSVEVQRPRLILSLGDVYNGPENCLAASI